MRAKTMLSAMLMLIPLLFYDSAQGAGAPASYSWTGFYVGLNSGVAINDSHYRLSPAGNFLGAGFAALNPLRTDSADLDDAAFTGGGQLGYNQQLGIVVLGLELDANYNGVDESDSVNRALAAPLVGRFIHTVKQKFDFFGTVRPRIGIAPATGWLIYGTGGLAYGHIRSSSNVLFTAAGDNYVGSASRTRAGWTAGGGAEFAVTNHWILRLEYLYLDLGEFSYNYTNQLFPGFDYRTDVKTRQHAIRLGVNFKF
jgi:outer membrane immunogenic protein